MPRRWIFSLGVLSLLALSCRGPEGPSGPSGEQSLTDPSITPSLLTSYPLDKSAGPYTDFNNRVLLRFNKIMDRTSMKRAVHLSSPLGDVRVDTSSVSIQNTDVFTLAPLDSRGAGFKFLWKIGTAYTVTVDTGAFDVNGNHLRFPVVVTFTPEPYFRVVSSTPANGATDVALGASIGLVFNSQVDSSIIPHIAIHPSLGGSWGYLAGFPSPDSSQLRFLSRGATLDTLYTVSVDTGARDKQGDHLGARFSSSFTSASFHMTSTSPLDGSVNVGVLGGINLLFTAPVDTLSLRKAWSITPSTPGTFQYVNAAMTQVIFQPDQRLVTATTYTVAIGDSARSLSGSPISAPYQFSFTTIPFQVTSAPAGGTVVATKAKFSVTFSDYFDPSTITSSVIISPSVPLNFSLPDNSTRFSFGPAGTFATNTTYIVMLTTGIKSKRGDSLASAQSFSFTTAPFSVSSSAPSDGSTDVPPTNAPSVQFNDLIDTGSVRGAFSISPATAGRFSMDPSRTWFSFLPFDPLATYTTYTITVGTSLRSASGSPLSTPYTFSFTTGGLALQYTTPSDNSSDIPLTSQLRFIFNGYIDTGTVRGAFTLTPPASGLLTFYRPDTGYTGFFFTPTGLASATSYSAGISTSLHSAAGQPLAQSAQLHFTTAHFAVMSTWPSAGVVNVEPSGISYFAVGFNGPVDTAGVDTVLTIAPPVSGIVNAQQGRSDIAYTQYENLRTGTQYTVRVSGSLKTVGGGTLESPYVFSFTTAPFHVRTVDPLDGSVGIARRPSMQVNMNAAIDTGSVRNAFTISPPADGFFSLYYGWNGFNFQPTADLLPQTTYTITLSTSIRTLYGDTLRAPWSAQFTTGN